MKNILVTGGTGYIGSHTVVELLNRGDNVIIVDNLSNSKIEVLDAIREITGKDVKFYNINYLDREALEKVFEENEIDSVINFAGYKAVGESVKEPLKYYENNVSGAIVLLETMQKYNVKKFVFSSSATIYGVQDSNKYVETMQRGIPSSPYGATKAMIEEILEDLYKSDPEWEISILRYFNPVGAHESGLLGEDPEGIPNNLMPYVQRVAAKKLPELTIFGDDYETPDGTCRRDYLHVVDLAKGHLKALDYINKAGSGIYVHNLGTGSPKSVLDIVTTFIKVNNIDVPYKFGPRREGDLPEYYADPTKAEQELGWKAEKSLEDICRDSWNYQKNKTN
jgi:UDP-glucose 4-epimerase